MQEVVFRRSLRAFRRWMQAQGIEISDGLELVEGEGAGIACGEVGVRAVYDLNKGDAIARIPKRACLTIRTTGAAEVLEEARFSGGLGLVVALMYEFSRGEASPWYPYLNLLSPRQEALPIVWNPHEIHTLLVGTELHQVVLEDQKLAREDWRECIQPLTEMYPHDFPKEDFSFEKYLSAKTLIASRAFEVDRFHGYGMVPIADLFNHKTGDEDVHIEGDHNSSPIGKWAEELEDVDFLDPLRLQKMMRVDTSSRSQSEDSSCSLEDQSGGGDVLEMILIKNVLSGSEIFNTYGELSNAALLHRYGFTEPNNPYDIVNIDFTLVTDYCTSIFSRRHVRSRVRLWRKYGCLACTSQNSDYFEVVACGKPQLELPFLLYIIHLPDDGFYTVELALDQLQLTSNPEKAFEWADKVMATIMNVAAASPSSQHRLSRKRQKQWHAAIEPTADDLEDILLTVDVCKGLLWLCDRRDKAYGATSLEEDMKLASALCQTEHPKLFHTHSLRMKIHSTHKHNKFDVTTKI